ncbi:MAG: aminotransferase class I/II-fold pyridoxal phosphate-dependent enzyme [Candidatus Omnitrophica bacterium]|nr:aminotransferase class I/II-fold pyridoxal phosphate-dependent enzyme [Candidatus Omnitrophota bacterium]
MIRRRLPRFYKGEIKDILISLIDGSFCKGGDIGKFEEKFAEYIGTEFALTVSSGRQALDMILASFGLEDGEEVIMSAYTLKNLVDIIEGRGLKARLVDIEPGSFNIDPLLIEKHITPKTRVIIATHIFGLPCDMDKICSIAKKRGILVVEDCAHALGSVYKGKKAGAIGDAAFFSLETIKPVNTFGGGVITTNDKTTAEKLKTISERCPYRPGRLALKILFSYFEHLVIISPLYILLVKALAWNRTGAFIKNFYLASHKSTNVRNSRFANIQAILGLKQLKDLDEKNAARRIAAYTLTRSLKEIVCAQEGDETQNRTFYFFVVKLPYLKEKLESLRYKLLKYGVDAGIRSEITDDCSAYMGISDNYPVTKSIYATSMQLPMHDGLRKNDIDLIKNAAEASLA